MKFAILTLPLLLTPITAQQAQPPKELAKLDRLCGHWQSQGTSKGSADGPNMKWTSTSFARRVLGGFFIQEDVLIKFEGDAIPPMAIRCMYGYDPKTKRYLSWSFSNSGEVATAEIDFIDDNTVLKTHTHVMMGKRTMERWVTKLDGKSMSFTGQMAQEADPFFEHVNGKGKKVDARPKLNFDKVGPFMAGPAAQTKKLGKMVGTFAFAGKASMPGMGDMKITGKSGSSMMFGGMLLETWVKGDPVMGMGAYEAWGAMVWDDKLKCYRNFWFSNHAEMAEETGNWINDTELVLISAREHMGMPVAQRSVMEFDKAGQMLRMYSDSSMATHKPMRSFEIKYTPLKGNKQGE